MKRKNILNVLSLIALSSISFSSYAVTGDVDGNGKLDITDGVYLLNYLFKGGPAPVSEFISEKRNEKWAAIESKFGRNDLPILETTYAEAADNNCSGSVDLTDATRITGFLFNGGSALISQRACAASRFQSTQPSWQSQIGTYLARLTIARRDVNGSLLEVVDIDRKLAVWETLKDPSRVWSSSFFQISLKDDIVSVSINGVLIRKFFKAEISSMTLKINWHSPEPEIRDTDHPICADNSRTECPIIGWRPEYVGSMLMLTNLSTGVRHRIFSCDDTFETAPARHAWCGGSNLLVYSGKAVIPSLSGNVSFMKTGGEFPSGQGLLEFSSETFGYKELINLN